MPNPRDTIDFTGIAAEYVTFKSDNATITYDANQNGGSAVVGRAVGLLAGTAGTVELVVDAQPVIGKLILVEQDNKCTVQVGGWCKLPGGTGLSAAATARGRRIVGALSGAARGYIRDAAPATLAEVAAANGRIMDPADTANVVCRF